MSTAPKKRSQEPSNPPSPSPLRSKSYAKEALPNEYSHRFHAGNVGDVWKHAVLTAIIQSAVSEETPLTVIDAFAGEGAYKLGPTGEWTEGIGALAKVAENTDKHSPMGSYLSLASSALTKDRRYLGSPLLLEQMLRPGDTLICHETSEEAAAQLRRSVRSSTIVKEGDGLAGLLECAQQSKIYPRLFALIDPPWNKKEDWASIPRRLIEALNAMPSMAMALWYPIKSYTRVNTMMRDFGAANVRGVAMDLITTPLDLQRNRLNGSGMLLVNIAPSVLSQVAAMAPLLGQACATHEGFWESRFRHTTAKPH